MLEIKENYCGKHDNSTCPLCQLETDTTEHLYQYSQVGL